MNVDKFGHHLFKKYYNKHECLLKYSSDGNLSAQNKSIQNLKIPIHADDCCTKDYVDSLIEKVMSKIKTVEQLNNEIMVKIRNVETTQKNEQGRRCK